MLPNLQPDRISARNPAQDLIICIRIMMRLIEAFTMLRINRLQIIRTMLPMTVRPHKAPFYWWIFKRKTTIGHISDLFSNFLQNICANNVRAEPSDVAISQNDQNSLPRAATLISKSPNVDIDGYYHNFELIKLLFSEQKMHRQRLPHSVYLIHHQIYERRLIWH